MKEIDRNQLQKASWRLMESYQGGALGPIPRGVSTVNCHEKLTPEQIREAVVLMTRFLGMDGSGGDFDLYRVVSEYILQPRLRPEINRVLCIR